MENIKDMHELHAVLVFLGGGEGGLFSKKQTFS